MQSKPHKTAIEEQSWVTEFGSVLKRDVSDYMEFYNYRRFGVV